MALGPQTLCFAMVWRPRGPKLIWRCAAARQPPCGRSPAGDGRRGARGGARAGGWGGSGQGARTASQGLRVRGLQSNWFLAPGPLKKGFWAVGPLWENRRALVLGALFYIKNLIFWKSHNFLKFLKNRVLGWFWFNFGSGLEFCVKNCMYYLVQIHFL